MSPSSSSCTVTVGICTRNRGPLLRTSLEQLARTAVPDDVTWEVIVVDNGSTDGTARVLEAMASQLPLRALRYDTPGKSHALNHAIQHARGDYILWTDDDVLVDRNGLRRTSRRSDAGPTPHSSAGRLNRGSTARLLSGWPTTGSASPTSSRSASLVTRRSSSTRYACPMARTSP